MWLFLNGSIHPFHNEAYLHFIFFSLEISNISLVEFFFPCHHLLCICLWFLYDIPTFWHEASSLFFLSFFFQNILGIGGSEEEDEV